MSDIANRIRDVLHAELRQLGHELVDQAAAGLDVDGTPVIVVAQGDGTVRIVHNGGEYRVAPAAVNWPLLTSALSALAIRGRTKQETNP